MRVTSIVTLLLALFFMACTDKPNEFSVEHSVKLMVPAGAFDRGYAELPFWLSGSLPPGRTAAADDWV